jgi:hypothetical protein
MLSNEQQYFVPKVLQAYFREGLKEMKNTVNANYNTTKKMKKDFQNGLKNFNASKLKAHLSSLNRNEKIKVKEMVN